MIPRLLGTYRLLAPLGQGGMGTVWLAETTEPCFGLPSGAQVAVKEIHPHLAGVEGFVRRFEREGDVGQRLRHENVVRTYGACDVASADGRPARLLVMEVVAGQTLRAMLDELGRVPEALCRHVGREAAKALAAIHGAGAVHRDVKPENVIVTPDNVVKVMDLGVARLKDQALRLSQTGTFVGSVLYAAPEQFLEGDEALDGRADLYALGLSLYELATGRHPFASDDLRVVMKRQIQDVPRRASEIHPPISPFFDEVLRTLLEKDPALRFPDAAGLAEVLAEGEASSWWASRPVRVVEGVRRPARRPRAPRESAMHGRVAEMECLRQAVARARAGEGAVVLLEGEAGIGKTRLVDEWLDELARAPDPVHVLVGGHPGGGVATGPGALAGAFRAHLGGDVRDERVRPLLVTAPLLVPGFAALLRGDAPPPGVEPLSKDAVQSAFVHAARALSDGHPTVILVEDLHNAPEDGLALFLSLALATPSRPLALVGTTRPGLPDAFASALDRNPVARRVALGRLGPKDLAALLTEALRSERLAEDLGFRVGAKSDGNPFFVFEILRALRESGRLTKTQDGSWVRTQAIREIEIPSTVRDLVQARLAGLEEEDKDLLDVASCCGDEFDPLLVGEALGVGRIPLLKRLGRLERKNRLVRSVDVRCVFDQRQVREAIYAALSELLRREYHAALGEALVAREEAAQRPPEAADGATRWRSPVT